MFVHFSETRNTSTHSPDVPHPFRHQLKLGSRVPQPKPLPDDQFRKIIGPLNAKSARFVSQNEQRRNARFAVYATVKCQGLDDEGLPVGVPFKAKVMNISQGGALLDTSSMSDAPLFHLLIMRGHNILAESVLAVVRRGAGTIAGYFVQKPVIAPIISETRR